MLVQLSLNYMLQLCTAHVVFNHLVEIEQSSVYCSAFGNNDCLVSRVIDAVEAYINGYADVGHTLRQLVYHKPNYQICILNQEIVDKCLQFKSYERV